MSPPPTARLRARPFCRTRLKVAPRLPGQASGQQPATPGCSATHRPHSPPSAPDSRRDVRAPGHRCQRTPTCQPIGTCRGASSGRSQTLTRLEGHTISTRVRRFFPRKAHLPAVGGGISSISSRVLTAATHDAESASHTAEEVGMALHRTSPKLDGLAVHASSSRASRSACPGARTSGGRSRRTGCSGTHGCRSRYSRWSSSSVTPGLRRSACRAGAVGLWPPPRARDLRPSVQPGFQRVVRQRLDLRPVQPGGPGPEHGAPDGATADPQAEGHLAVALAQSPYLKALRCPFSVRSAPFLDAAGSSTTSVGTLPGVAFITGSLGPSASPPRIAPFRRSHIFAVWAA